MSAPSPAHPVTVTGGSSGITAQCDDLRRLAAQFGTVGADTFESTAALHACLLYPGLAVSALLDPIGFADFESELLAALDGWQGLTWAATECTALAAELRLSATLYEGADRLDTLTRDVVLGGLDALPAFAAALTELVRTGDPVQAAQLAVARDPRLADVLVTMLGIPGLLESLAAAIPDGHGVVEGPGIDRTGAAARPPRNLGDVLRELDQRDGDERHGAIDVRILTLPDGSRRAIVDITGTKSWDPFPTQDVTSLTTDGRALVGRRTAYEQGVLAAMRAAGVRPRDPVMLVGHSEGGLIAVNAARDAAADGGFTVTHVITAGAPIGRIVGALPASVQVLALENTRDVVPHLDGLANPDRRNVTTVSGTRGDGTIVGDHQIGGAYLPLATDAQASGDPSIRDFLRTADGYFRADAVETHTYQIGRRY
jgi:hypothetical protein